MKKKGLAALSISLPVSLRNLVERRVRQGGFGNVSEYIRLLIRTDAEAPSEPSRRPLVGPLPGLGSRRRGSSTAAPTVREGRPLASSSPVIDFGAESWRELREALLAGEVAVMQRRLFEAAELFRAALTMRYAMIQEERPRAGKEVWTAELASWLREQGAESEDPALRPAPERLARFQRG